MLDILSWMTALNPAEILKQEHVSGQLKQEFPEIDALYGVPQPAEHHPEIDTGVHLELVLARACELSLDPAVKFAALVHDLGKGKTSPEKWPRHLGHEISGIAPFRQMCKRVAIPREWLWLGHVAIKWHQNCHTFLTMTPRGRVKFLLRSGLAKRPHLVPKLVLVAQADAQGRLGMADKPYPQAEAILHASKVLGPLRDMPRQSQDDWGRFVQAFIVALKVVIH